jgi:hypothetical protein
MLLSPANPFESGEAPTPLNAVDEAVFARLAALKIEPATVCSDGVFLRRACLDVIGTLPTADEARAFLADRDPAKRERLIDRLLERDEFADYWTMKWCDLLRVKAEFPINLWPNAVQAYERWIRTAVRENRPYDRFARELLTSSGSNFRVPPVNFYRAVESRDPPGLARAAVLTFMGERIERWPAARREGLECFFSQVALKSTREWKEEIVYFDPERTNALGRATAAGVLPDGKKVRFSPDRDPREDFADWLISPKNPSFARAIANRAWSWFMGRGIVHEPDDIRPDNPPSNPELLAVLEKELVSSNWDLKRLFRLILTSRTYQLSPVPRSADPAAEANFARYAPRRLDAEVLADALNQITGTTESYSSPIPEPFTYLPEEQRSIALGDGSITSSFLEQFGRPPRDTGLESERNNNPTADQWLHLLNSSHVQRKIEQGPRIQALLRKDARPREIVGALYLSILSRPPTAAEAQAVAGYFLREGTNPRDAAIDLVWSLINSPEFLYRH